MALAVLAFGGAPVLAEDDTSDETKEEPQGIQWIEGFKAGTEVAKKDGRLIFLYFGRNVPQ